MPAYGYRCEEHGEFEHFFKTLPSEAKQKSMPCPDCDKPGVRLLSNFMVNGTQHSGMEEVTSFAAPSADIGGRRRPVFRDNNGQVHEIKTSKDIDRWRTDNRLGPPRMVEWTNPITGTKSWVPQRIKMVAGPDGEPLDAPVVREQGKIVPLDNHYEPPKESRNGVPFNKNGVSVLKGQDPGLRQHGRPVIDPTTGKPMKMSDLWGGPVKNPAAERDQGTVTPQIQKAILPSKLKKNG